jgi:hypothetical protein
VPEPDRDRSGEDPSERINRELIELLNELRVALPGVQVLFGFLLVVPFNQRWNDVTDLQRDIYFVTLLLTAASTAFLIAPSATHRLRFRAHDKARLIEISNRYAIIGLALLCLALTGAVLLVADVLFGTGEAALVAALTFAVFGGLWFVIPLRMVLEGGQDKR